MRGEQRNVWLALAGIFAVALWLRVWGLTFGLPYSYHVDEYVYRLSAQVTRESIHPHFSPFQVLVLALRPLLHPVFDRLDLPLRLAATVDAASFLQLVGRWCSALLGAATVIPLFLLGRRLWNDAVGLIAAAFLAVAFTHARSSHYGVPDAMLCFFTVLAAYYCTRLSPSGPVRPYLLAGLFGGLAFSCKPLVWPVFVLIALFHLFPLRSGEPGDRPRGAGAWIRRLLAGRLIAAAAVSVAAFLATAPQYLLHWDKTMAFWKYAVQIGAAGGMDRIRLDDGPAARFYLGALDWGLGHLLFAACLAGFVLVLVRRQPQQVALMLCFPVLFYAFLCKPGNMYFARYGLAAVPFLLLAAADLVWSGLGRLRLQGRPRRLAAAAVTVLLAAQTAWHLVLHDILLTREDTRTLAKLWIEENVPEGSTVLLESWWFGPQLASETVAVPLSQRKYDIRQLGPYGLSERAQSFGPTAGTPAVSDYADQGIEYIVTNSITSRSHLLDPREDAAKREFYRALDREAILLKELSPWEGDFEPPRVFEHTYGPATFLHRMERPGPSIRIYRLRQPEGQLE